MATLPASTGVPSCAPFIPATSARLSRRSMLGGLAAGTATVIAAAPPVWGGSIEERTSAMNMLSIVNASPADTNDVWECALARFRAAKAMSEHFDEAEFKPAYDEIQKRAPRPSLDYTVKWDGPNGSVNSQTFLAFPAKLDELCEQEFYGEFVKPVRDAWRHYVREEASAQRDVGWAEIEQRDTELTANLDQAEDELMRSPSPDAETFAAKVRHVILDRGSYRHAWLEVIGEEAARFAQGVRIDPDAG